MNSCRVLLGESAIFFISVEYKNALLNILVINALALEKITQVIATSYLLIESCS